MKDYSYQEIKDIWYKHDCKKCIECGGENVKYTGSSPHGGWVSYYECEDCKTKYEWSDSDMGQTIPSLSSDADEKELKNVTVIRQNNKEFVIKNNTLTEFYYVDEDGKHKGFMCSIEHVMLAFEKYSSKFTISATASFDNEKNE